MSDRRDAGGNIIFDQVSDQTYHERIREEVRNWSYMKFPYLTELGKDAGWYRVGPLARINNREQRRHSTGIGVGFPADHTH